MRSGLNWNVVKEGALKLFPISVNDLLSLLENRDLELYRETAKIHSELRKV